MSRVSYQAMLADDGGPPFVPLAETALATRRKEATETLKVPVSKRQREFLTTVATGGGLDRSSTVAAALDLMIALDLDWHAISRPAELRRAVRDAVRVRTGAW